MFPKLVLSCPKCFLDKSVSARRYKYLYQFCIFVLFCARCKVNKYEVVTYSTMPCANSTGMEFSLLVILLLTNKQLCRSITSYLCWKLLPVSATSHHRPLAHSSLMYRRTCCCRHRCRVIALQQRLIALFQIAAEPDDGPIVPGRRSARLLRSIPGPEDLLAGPPPDQGHAPVAEPASGQFPGELELFAPQVANFQFCRPLNRPPPL